MATTPPSYETLAEENRRLRTELAALRNGGHGSSDSSSRLESPSATLPPLTPVERLSAAQVRARV